MDDRKLEVLRAIVTDYVSSQEPVGSKSLVEHHDLGVSPATVRNDMAALEEEGYIMQPHTSAGRIPTDKGYRLFVDRLGSLKPLSAAEQRAIQTFKPRALLVVGVAGSLKDGVKSGDVVVADWIHSYHGGKEDEDGFHARPRGGPAGHRLQQVAYATSLTVLILLALGTFVAGVHAAVWRICAVGVFLALSVPAVAWVQESAMLLLVVALLIVLVGAAFWFMRWRESRD
mgnify:CR=1 FL=1